MVLLAVLLFGLFALGFARYLVLAVFLGGCFGDVFLLARFSFSEHNYGIYILNSLKSQHTILF